MDVFCRKILFKAILQVKDLELTKLLYMYGITGGGKMSALTAILGRDPLAIGCSTPLMKRPINVCYCREEERMEGTES